MTDEAKQLFNLVYEYGKRLVAHDKAHDHGEQKRMVVAWRLMLQARDRLDDFIRQCLQTQATDQPAKKRLKCQAVYVTGSHRRRCMRAAGHLGKHRHHTKRVDVQWDNAEFLPPAEPQEHETHVADDAVA
jgi:hypothetical protein